MLVAYGTSWRKIVCIQPAGGVPAHWLWLLIEKTHLCFHLILNRFALVYGHPLYRDEASFVWRRRSILSLALFSTGQTDFEGIRCKLLRWPPAGRSGWDDGLCSFSQPNFLAVVLARDHIRSYWSQCVFFCDANRGRRNESASIVTNNDWGLDRTTRSHPQLQ